MPQIVFGVPALHGFDVLGPVLPVYNIVQAVRQVQDRYMDEAIRRGRKYPAKTPQQEYKRTGRIASSWRKVASVLTPDGIISASVYNTATEPARKGYRRAPRYYAPYVFGDAALGIEQAAVHRGRWPLERELVDERAYQRDIYAAIVQAIAAR